MSGLGDLCGPRAREAADGLMAVLQPLVRSPGGRQRVPGVVIELLTALMQQAAASGSGNTRSEGGSMDDVNRWVSAEAAGRAVGLTGRRVRQMCDADVVAHRRLGARSLAVDLDDLQRHLRTRAVS